MKTKAYIRRQLPPEIQYYSFEMTLKRHLDIVTGQHIFEERDMTHSKKRAWNVYYTKEVAKHGK